MEKSVIFGEDDLENAVAERINVLVCFAVFCQMLGMFMHILHHGEKITAVHKDTFGFYIGMLSIEMKS